MPARDNITNAQVVEYLDQRIEFLEDGEEKDRLIKERTRRTSSVWLDKYLCGDVDG